ncbi:MAG: hypothetical protein R3C04_08115 [Hyphomonas sp.]
MQETHPGKIYPPHSARVHLARMSLPEDFLAHALRVLGDALVAIIGRAELHLRPDFMARGVARRAARQMRASP